MAFIGALLIGLYLLLVTLNDKGKWARQNRAYEEDRKAHNYNDDLQFKIRSGNDELRYPYYQGLWELVNNCKLSCRIAQDVVMAKKLRDKGYDFNPYHGNFNPLTGTDGYKDVELGTRLYEEYRQKVYSLVDKYTEDNSKDCVKGFKYDEKVTYDINGLKTVEYKLPRF